MLAELAAARDREIADQAELARAERLTRIAATTASIAHEINNPLAAILTNANAGLRWITHATPNIDETKKTLQNILRASQGAADVVAGIRTMFKVDNEARFPIDLNQLIEDVLKLTRGELHRHMIVVRTEIHESLPRVMVNRVQLQQVMLNLVMNAIDAMAAVTQRERILKIASKLDDNKQVCVTVEDSGTGIDPKNADQIFHLFFTTKVHGMGMGLSICRSIVEAHNGRLWASPGNPYGTTFYVLLPTSV